MFLGWRQTKLTITLQDTQLAEVHALVIAKQAASVAAFVQYAVSVVLNDFADWRQILENSLQKTGGPLTKQERAWADAILSPDRGAQIL